MNKVIMSVVLGAMVALPVGCRGTAPAPKPPKPPKPAEYPEVIWQRPTSMPDWVSKTPAGDDFLFFKGISLPDRYESKARERAFNDAAQMISKYIFTAAGYRWVGVDVGTNARGNVMIQAIAQASLFDNISKAIVRNAYELETYTRYERDREYGVLVKYFKVYVLVQWPKAEAVALKDAAVAGALQELQKQHDEEVDAIKKRQLEEAMKTLRKIEETGLEAGQSD